MSDITARLRTAQTLAYFDQSYPPSVLAQGAPDPHIDTLVPNTISAAAGASVITVNGTNFDAGSVIEIDQLAKATTYVSATQLTVNWDPSAAGTELFTVRNPSGQESNSVPFIVAALTADEVVDGTVDEVKAWVTANPDRAAEVAVAERADRCRSTLLTWLDERTAEGVYRDPGEV